METNKEVRQFVDEALLRYQIARQEVEGMCCLTDTLEFVQMDVLRLMGIVHSMADLLDKNGLHSHEAREFAKNFQVTP